MPSQSVLAIGGALGGLSSAIVLADAGFRVQLLEKRPHLGGRATSYTLPDGSEVDNCQHVTLGCCTNLADFYRRVGASEKIRFYDRLYFVDREGRRSEIQASPLPPPLHMAPSFLLFDALTLADKRSIAEAMLAIARAGGNPPRADGATMLDWLHSMRQTTGAIERFWRVGLVSALDEELARTDAKYGIEVFWKGFLSNPLGYRVGIPSVPLAELYEGCREAIARRGGQVRLRSGVRRVCVQRDRFAGAILDDGTEMEADACISAVPHDVLLSLVPREMAEPGGPLEGLRYIKTSPITSVHFWFDRTVMTEPFLTLLASGAETNGSKARPTGHHEGTLAAEVRVEKGGEDGQYLQLVISASYDLVPRSRAEIIELCRRELADVVPATREANVLKATVIKEVNATFSPEPGVDRWRPAQTTPISNLFLAGDWTQTGWPSTMEGAVRSGYLAAEAALTRFSQPAALLQPDLPAEGLCKYWARRSAPGTN